jgi:hypothetical protein
MVNPLTRATRGRLSDGTHVPLLIAVSGRLLFDVVAPSMGMVGGNTSSYEEEIRGGSGLRYGIEEDEDEVVILSAQTLIALCL